MHIAQLAGAVLPKLYGGTERVVSWLTDELVGMGHEVALFASGGSISNAALVAARSWHQDPLLPYSAMLARLAELASQFDVVHSHLDWVRIPLLRRLSVPFVTTLHGRIDALGLEIVKRSSPLARCPDNHLQLIKGIMRMKGVGVVEPARYDPQDLRR
jgi:glycosyltransferase involved in cell wall biosynthesis